MSLKPIYKDLVASIQKHLNDDLLDCPRVTSLPGLIRRHGLPLTAIFLKSKKGLDDELMKLLTNCINDLPSASQVDLSKPESLTRLSAYQLIRLQEQALEAAVWIQRIVAARKELKDLNQTADGGAS